MSWRTDSWLSGVREGKRAGYGMGEALGTEIWILIVVAVTGSITQIKLHRTLLACM